MGRAGKALKQVLDTYGITQNQLAVAMGIRRFNVSRWVSEIVAQLWIYRRDRLLIYCFEGKQSREYQISQHFPDRDIKTLLPQYVNRGWQVGSSVALREF
jgi:hypothetical protein